jgi:hypothetical protein
MGRNINSKLELMFRSINVVSESFNLLFVRNKLISERSR